MSLVNDALKRADEEKGQRLAGVTPPGPPVDEVSEAPRPWLRRLALPLCLAVLVVALAAYGIQWAAGRFLTEATAAVDDLKQQASAALPGAAPAVPVASADAGPAKAQASSAGQPKAGTPASGVGPQARAATTRITAASDTCSRCFALMMSLHCYQFSTWPPVSFGTRCSILVATAFWGGIADNRQFGLQKVEQILHTRESPSQFLAQHLLYGKAPPDALIERCAPLLPTTQLRSF